MQICPKDGIPLFWGSLFALLLLFFGASCEQAAPNVAARVGSVAIPIDDLRAFAAGTPAILRSEEEGAAAARDYLQTLIDMELMLLEARNKGIDQGSEFVSQWEDVRRQKLIDEYLQRELLPGVKITEELIDSEFLESRWARKLKLAHIKLGSQEEGEAVLRALEAGAVFEDLARERSLDPVTGPNGGLSEYGFIGRDDLRQARLPPVIANEVFELPVGGVGGPFRLAEGYHVFKVVDAKPAPDSYKVVFTEFLYKREVLAAKDSTVDSLKPKYNAKVDDAALAVLIEEGEKTGHIFSMPDEHRGQIVGTYDGGEFNVWDVCDEYFDVRFLFALKYNQDSFKKFIDRYMFSRRLYYLEALRLGIDRDPPVAMWLEDKRKSMLLTALKDLEVQAKLDTTDSKAREYYEANLYRFQEPRTTSLIEILVPTREKADSLLREIENGADMVALALKHSTRKQAKKQDGRIHLHPFERPVFGPLHDAAMDEAEIGVLTGPIELNDGFSIFKVEERQPKRPETFERARSRSKYWLRKTQEHALFDELMARLREQYASQVVVYETTLNGLEL